MRERGNEKEGSVKQGRTRVSRYFYESFNDPQNKFARKSEILIPFFMGFFSSFIHVFIFIAQNERAA